MEFNFIQFFLMTFILFGWCSYQLGKAMANTWPNLIGTWRHPPRGCKWPPHLSR